MKRVTVFLAALSLPAAAYAQEGSYELRPWGKEASLHGRIELRVESVPGSASLSVVRVARLAGKTLRAQGKASFSAGRLSVKFEPSPGGPATAVYSLNKNRIFGFVQHETAGGKPRSSCEHGARAPKGARALVVRYVASVEAHGSPGLGRDVLDALGRHLFHRLAAEDASPNEGRELSALLAEFPRLAASPVLGPETRVLERDFPPEFTVEELLTGAEGSLGKKGALALALALARHYVAVETLRRKGLSATAPIPQSFEESQVHSILAHFPKLRAEVDTTFGGS